MGWAEDMTDPPTTRTDVLRASPPMFDSRVLDALSRVHPAVPVIIFGARDRGAGGVGAVECERGAHASALFVAATRCGRCSSTGCTASCSTSSPRTGSARGMHWIIHGVHHDHPNDPLRLVMPPAVSVPLAPVVFGVLYPDLRLQLRARARRGLLRRLPGLRHDPLLPAPLPPARAAGQDAARAPHAPPLPGRHARLRDQRALLGRGVRHLLARRQSGISPIERN